MEMPKPYSIGQRCCIKPWQRLQYWTFKSDTRLETAWVFEIFLNLSGWNIRSGKLGSTHKISSFFENVKNFSNRFY